MLTSTVWSVHLPYFTLVYTIPEAASRTHLLEVSEDPVLSCERETRQFPPSHRPSCTPSCPLSTGTFSTFSFVFPGILDLVDSSGSWRERKRGREREEDAAATRRVRSVASRNYSHVHGGGCHKLRGSSTDDDDDDDNSVLFPTAFTTVFTERKSAMPPKKPNPPSSSKVKDDKVSSLIDRSILLF